MKFDLQLVSKAHNLHFIGWTNGYVMVEFRGKPDRYIYGPDIPRSEVDKVLRNPYPDRIFETCIKRKYKCYKVGDTA